MPESVDKHMLPVAFAHELALIYAGMIRDFLSSHFCISIINHVYVFLAFNSSHVDKAARLRHELREPLR